MVWVVLDRSGSIGTVDFWDEGVMAAHYDKGNGPEWFETDDGHLKANLKRGPAMSLTNRYDRLHLYDDFYGDDDDHPGKGGGGGGGGGNGPGGDGPPGQQSVDDSEDSGDSDDDDGGDNDPADGDDE